MRFHRKKLLDLLVLLLCVHENYANDNSASEDGFSQNSTIAENADNRLQNSVIPVTYKIMLSPDSDKEPFSLQGTVKIQMKVSEKPNKIILHVGKLDVNSVTVNDSDDISSHTLQSFYSAKTGDLTIPLVNPIPKNTVIIIAIRDQGILMHRMIGFYKSSYYDQEKNLKWLGTIQFQASHAIHAFPFSDEPSINAVFKINILRKLSQKSLINATTHKETDTLIGIQKDHPYEDTRRSGRRSRHAEIVKNRSRNIDAAFTELSQNGAGTVDAVTEAINLMDVSGTAIATNNTGVSNHTATAAATTTIVTTDATTANATTETNLADVYYVPDVVDPAYIVLAILLMVVIIIVGFIACIWMLRKLTMNQAGRDGSRDMKVSCFTGICVCTKN